MALATTKTRTTKKQSAVDNDRTTVARAAELSGEILASVEAGHRAALGAVHRFVDTLDESLPAIGDHPSRRDRVIDAALDMADRLVTAQYEFLRSVLHSVDRTQPAGKQTKEGEATNRPAANKAAANKAAANKAAAKKAVKRPATKTAAGKQRVAAKKST